MINRGLWGKEESLFEAVATGRFLMLQWVVPHLCTYGRHQWDFVGSKSKSKLWGNCWEDMGELEGITEGFL